MGVKALFDTNIVIDYLKGIKQAKAEIERYINRFLSIITYMEVLIGADNPKQEKAIKSFLKSFEIINVDQEIAEIAIKKRKELKIKLPDAIILATANREQSLLITRNTKDFASSLPSVRIPYQLK